MCIELRWSVCMYVYMKLLRLMLMMAGNTTGNLPDIYCTPSPPFPRSHPEFGQQQRTIPSIRYEPTHTFPSSRPKWHVNDVPVAAYRMKDTPFQHCVSSPVLVLSACGPITAKRSKMTLQTEREKHAMGYSYTSPRRGREEEVV